ncbi:acyltransferase domain-containing protein [Streptomyces caatingaensis]|uniref:acyltransferase domain-containing protein n=1 Tax=Streptomyces caatingaensis TaxID=1678637 RepID=UPI00069FDA8B|nr:acyltransferase domain-containing protein [Streptomyces caatingaensis]
MSLKEPKERTAYENRAAVGTAGRLHRVPGPLLDRRRPPAPLTRREPPPRPAAPPARHELLVVSAPTPAAADREALRLAGRLEGRPGTDLRHVARALQTGRAHHAHRRFVVARDADGAAAALRAGPGAGFPAAAGPVFLYAGQAGQHLGMAEGLYRDEPEFRRHLDDVAEWACGPLGLDLRETLFPATERERPAAAARLAAVALSQPAVFAVQYATTRLLEAWGLRPDAVAGYCLGAYAAACAAGVFAPWDATRIVVERARLLGSVPAGATAAVRLPEERLVGRLPAGLSVAAVNGPGQCTVTGPAEAVARFAGALRCEGVDTRLLRRDTVGHSPVVEPVTDRFAAFLGEVGRERPVLPVVSDTTGRWADPEELRSVAYWIRHLRAPVRFGEALSTLFAGPARALADVGPGGVLSAPARRHPAYDAAHAVVHLAAHPAGDTSQQSAALLAGVGALWARGAAVDFAALGRRGRATP